MRDGERQVEYGRRYTNVTYFVPPRLSIACVNERMNQQYNQKLRVVRLVVDDVHEQCNDWERCKWHYGEGIINLELTALIEAR